MFRSIYRLLPQGVPFTFIICIIMGQEFTLVPQPVYQLTAGNHSIELIWDFEEGAISLSGTTWRNGNNDLLMKKTANQTPEVSSGFSDRVFYHSRFGLSITKLTKEDEGEYTCRAVYSGGLKESKVNVTLYDVIGELSPEIELYGDGAGIAKGTDVILESYLTAKCFVPIQDPVAITTTISTVFDGSVEIRETCNDNNGTYCEATFMAPNTTGELIISACNSHPALTEELCERLAVNIIDLPTCQSSCKNGGTCNQATLKCICLDGFTGDTCDKGPDDPGAECKWWCILLIVLPMVIVVIVIICCCWHYKVACFRHKCCPWSSNRSRPSTAACSKVDVNDVERTVTSGSHGNKQDAGNKDSPYRPDGNMPQKRDGSRGLQVPQGVPVTNSDQKRPMPSPGRKTVLPPLEDPERSKKKKNRKSREEE